MVIIKAHANVASLFLFVVLGMTVLYLLYSCTQCGSLHLLTCVTAVHNALYCQRVVVCYTAGFQNRVHSMNIWTSETLYIHTCL